MNGEDYHIKDTLGFILYRTALALKSALQRCLNENGYEITPEQWGLIRHLWEEEGLSQREIGEKAAKDKPNVTRILDACFTFGHRSTPAMSQARSLRDRVISEKIR